LPPRPSPGSPQRARKPIQELLMSTLDPQGQPQPPHDPRAQPLSASPYGTAPGQPAPVAPKKRKTGLYIALGCGVLALIVLVLIAGCAALVATSGDDSDDAAGTQETTEQAEAPSEDVADETAEDEAAAEDATAEDAAVEDEEETAEEADVPADHASALTQAESYSDTMHMSKQAIFDQLTSEYGGQFTEEAAQYAIDNVEADWNENALESAKTYSDLMYMSKQGIYD